MRSTRRSGNGAILTTIGVSSCVRDKSFSAISPLGKGHLTIGRTVALPFAPKVTLPLPRQNRTLAPNGDNGLLQLKLQPLPFPLPRLPHRHNRHNLVKRQRERSKRAIRGQSPRLGDEPAGDARRRRDGTSPFSLLTSTRLDALLVPLLADSLKRTLPDIIPEFHEFLFTHVGSQEHLRTGAFITQAHTSRSCVQRAIDNVCT